VAVAGLDRLDYPQQIGLYVLVRCVAMVYTGGILWGRVSGLGEE